MGGLRWGLDFVDNFVGFGMWYVFGYLWYGVGKDKGRVFVGGGCLDMIERFRGILLFGRGED